MATSGLSNDTCNFQCVTVASVAVIKLPLRDILANHIQPQDLFQKIQSCSTLKLRQDQLKLCCIPPPDVPDYNKFDVTLLYTLIRNLCSLPRPAQGWGNEPTANDTQISDDIERLRLFRNNFYAHAESAVIADAVFKDVWKNLKLVFRRIQPKMGYSVDYEEELMNIERTKFTDDFLANFRVLLETFAKFEIQTDGRDEPDIFIQGENEIICGSTAQIEAEVKKVESSCWSITWRKRRGDVIKCIDTDMEKYKGSSKKTLVINSVCKEDEGEYQAVLSPELNGPEYKSRNTIRLHAVGEIPFLTISEVSLGSEGITIHFNCGVLEQSPKVHLIEWSKNGKKLDNKSNKYVGEGIDNRQLTITSPTYEDRGKYNCKVSNAVGSVSKNVMLDVPCVELLEVSPIFCGSKTAIKCVISSTPTPENIEWQTSRDGVDFQSIRRAKYFDNTDNSFVIHKATFADKLYYRLRVWNGIGETISNTVYLNVTGSPPNIKTIPETNIKNRSVKLIGSVIIYDDSPGVKNHFWTRNQKTIDFEECNGRLSETRTDNPSLTITNVGPDDAGEYRLTAMNDVGSFTSEAIVLGVPRVSEEKVEDEDNGGQRITVTIKSIPEPCHVQWSVKRKEDDTFVQIDIYAKEYEGTTVTLPHPVLFVKQKDQLENICFRIEVTNFIGNTQREISGNCTTKQRKIDNVENTIYNDDGEIFEFTILSSTLVKQFPIGKLDHLKFLIKKSNKVKNPASVKEATSVLECIDILQDENLFTPTDVIYMQFLCQEADCFDLFTKCVEYAESKQRALCYFKKPPVNGYKDVQFHVQGDVSGYTKDYINHVIKTVAVILRCKEEDVLLNGAQHSKSFLLSLSIKEPYVRKLLALEVKDRLKLRGLNIDYLIIDGNILDIEIPKGKEAVFESNDKMNPMEKESTHSSMMRSQEDGASIDVPSVRIFVDSPVCFGSETIIKSVVSSTPTPRKTEWQKSKDGIDFHLIGKPNIYLGSNENFKNPFLVIPKTTFADKLFYRLWVWNRVGKSASNTFHLNVTGSPPNITTSFVTNIRNKSVKLMGEVYFLEKSPGILKTFWTKNGEKINIKESGGKLSELITDNPSLTITNVGPEDAGKYKVTAVNAVGSTTSEVIVLGFPSVFSERVEDEKNGGQRITVTITSFPTPCQIQWNAKSKDNDTFTPIDIHAEEYDGTTVTFPHSVLVVRQRDQLEKNCYQIEVTNFIGKTVQTITGNNKPTVRKKAAYLGLLTTQSFKKRSPSTGVPLRNQVDRHHAALYRTSSPHASKGIQEETEHERLPPGQDPGPLTGLSSGNSNLIESLADVDGALKVTAHVDEELQNLRAMEQKTLSKTKEKKIINDPIWGPIKLDPLCMKIIDTPQFQRLRHIKQLGGCSFVFPGACHNRFEHSIGTAHLARMMGDELQKKHTKETITDQEILCLEVAGLCHDLGHGPFSHVFDQQFQNKCKGKKWTHEDLSIKMLDKVFETLERSVDLKELIGDKGEELIKDLIEPSRALRKEKPFLYEIISNEENKIDVDKWDYFSRDCHMLGLHHNFQCQRSIKLARIVENHISFPKSEYFNLFDMFYTRFTLHRRAYQHPVVKAVEMMIADAFLKADNYLTFLPVGNPGEDAGKENKKVPKPLSESMDCMDTYQGVTDDVLQQIRRLELDTDKNSDKHKNVKAAQDIIDRIYCRDLYTLIGEKRVEWDTETIKSGSCGKEITKKLIEADCKSSSFEIEEAVFYYGNKNEDPMSDVNFYHKKKDEKDMNRSKLYELVKGNVMKKDPEISDMLPEKFQQIYIRLYWKGSKSDDIKKQEIKDAFSRITDVQVQVKEEDEEKEITVKFADTKSYKD